MNYFKFNIGDYAAATRHLTMLEHGAYRLLLDVYYTTERPIPLDMKVAARKAGARTKDEIQAVETVLREFFIETQDGWKHARCETEIAAYVQKAETNRVVGKRGGRPKKETQTVSDQNPEKTQTVSDGFPEKTLTTNQEPITNTPKAPTGADVRFDRFWAAYPNKVGKDAARRAFDKRKPDDHLIETMLEAIDRQSRSAKWLKDGGQFIPNPATWINQGRWKDEDEATVSVGFSNPMFAGAI